MNETAAKDGTSTQTSPTTTGESSAKTGAQSSSTGKPASTTQDALPETSPRPTDQVGRGSPPPGHQRPEPQPGTSTTTTATNPAPKVTWIAAKAVKASAFRTDTRRGKRNEAKRGVPSIRDLLNSAGFPTNPADAKQKIGNRFPKGKLFDDNEWAAFQQLSVSREGQLWLNASGMLTYDQVKDYLSDDESKNPERFRGFHQLHKATKVVLASYVSRQRSSEQDARKFRGTPPTAIALSMEARHTSDQEREKALKNEIDQIITEEWTKTLEHTELNDDAITAIELGAVADPTNPKKTLNADEVRDRHRQSIEVLKNVFHLLQEGAEIYDASEKRHVPLRGVPVAKLLSHGGRVNIQIPAGSPPHALTELLGITDGDGNPKTGVFKRSFGTHHIALGKGKFKEEGGQFAAIRAKLDDTRLYGINLAIGGIGQRDFNGDVILPDGAHGHMFIGYRPPKSDRLGALQIGIETTGPNAPSTVGYIHNWRSTEKTANPISSVGGLKQDKIGDEKTKNARTVNLGKLGDDWASILKDRAARFEQDLAQRGRDALITLVGPRQDAQGQPTHAGADGRGHTERAAELLAGAAAPKAPPSPAPTPAEAGDAAQRDSNPQRQGQAVDALVRSIDEQSRAWSRPASAQDRSEATQLLTELLQRQNVRPSVVDRMRELIHDPASLSQSAFANCGLHSILYLTLKNDLATIAHLVTALFTGKQLGHFASAPGADTFRQRRPGTGALSHGLDLIRRVMTGEVPQTLGQAPTRPLVNGLRTAKAKGDSLKKDSDREDLDRHLLDHLLARGLIELLGPDAVAKLEQQTDRAQQPGVAAAQGDMLLSASSVAGFMSSALGADASVMLPSTPGGFDVTRVNEVLRQTDRGGFAVATVLDGKALWHAANAHEPSASAPHDPAEITRLGAVDTLRPHHAPIDGPITSHGDSFIVPLQSWGRTFPVRVRTEDMPKVFAAITYGTTLPSRAPETSVPTEQGAPAPRWEEDLLAGTLSENVRSTSILDAAVERFVPGARREEISRLLRQKVDAQLVPELRAALPRTSAQAVDRLAEEIVEKWLMFNQSLLNDPEKKLESHLNGHIELVLGIFDRDRGQLLSRGNDRDDRNAESPSEVSDKDSKPEGSAPTPQEHLESDAGKPSDASTTNSEVGAHGEDPAAAKTPASGEEGYEDPFAVMQTEELVEPTEPTGSTRSLPDRSSDAEKDIPDWLWARLHNATSYAPLRTALLQSLANDASRDVVSSALAKILEEENNHVRHFMPVVLKGITGDLRGDSLKRELGTVLAPYKGEQRELAFDFAKAIGALDSLTESGEDLTALRNPPEPPAEKLPHEVLKRAHEERWVTQSEIDKVSRAIGRRAFSGMLERAMSKAKESKAKVGNIRALIEHMVRHAEHMDKPTLSPPLTSRSLVVDSNLVDTLLKPRNELPPSKQHIRDQLEALIRNHDIEDLRLTNVGVGEMFEYGDIVGRTFTTADGREIPWRGVRLDPGVRDRKDDYDRGFDELTKASVGETKGSADRSMVADAFFSERAPGAVPHFATSDHGILKPLLRFAGIDPTGRGQTALADFIKENNSDGAPYFRPRLMERELKTHAITNLDERSHAAHEDAAPEQSKPTGATLLDLSAGPARRVNDLIDLIEKAGFSVYIVGGAVRDALLGKTPEDVDLKTNMPLHELEEALRADPGFGPLHIVPEQRLLRVQSESNTTDENESNTIDESESNTINKNKKKRITIDIIAGGSAPEPFNLLEDALKRDFRMNALYLDKNGYLEEPLEGAIDDQLMGRLRFASDPGPSAPLADRVDAIRDQLRRAPWDFGRLIKFYQRGYALDEEIEDALREHAKDILSSIKERPTALLDKSLLLQKASVDSPKWLIEIMEALRFGPEAIREIIPDDVAGYFDPESAAFERDIVPRWRDTPDDNDTQYPLGAPEMKVDIATGRIYQYRVHAKARPPQWSHGDEEHVIIDVDLSNHNQAGHEAPHYHVYRWRERDGRFRWDKKGNGFSETGQPGFPDIDGGVYHGPQPWRFDEGLDTAGDFFQAVRERIRDVGITLDESGGLFDLGGQVKLHPERLRELHRAGQLGKLLMLVKNLSDGMSWSPYDQATLDLSGSHRGQQRLRFKPQLDKVEPFLVESGIKAPTSDGRFAEGGVMRRDALLRLYDLVSSEPPAELRRQAAEYALRHATTVNEFVERFEFYVASSRTDPQGANMDAMWDTMLRSVAEAGAVTDVTLEEGGDQVARLREAADRLGFASAGSAAYHAKKHGAEFPPKGGPDTAASPADEVRRYLAAARKAIREADYVERTTEEDGATNIVFWNGATKVVTRVGRDNKAHIVTAFVKGARSAAYTATRGPEEAPREDRGEDGEDRANLLAAYNPRLDEAADARQAAGEPAHGIPADGAPTAEQHSAQGQRSTVEALVNTLNERGRTWSRPTTDAHKKEAVKLTSDLLRSLGVDEAVIRRLGEMIECC